MSAAQRAQVGAGGLPPSAWAGPVLTVEIDGDRRIGALPTDGRLGLSIGWLQAGLAEATTVLELDDLENLADRVHLLRG